VTLSINDFLKIFPSILSKGILNFIKIIIKFYQLLISPLLPNSCRFYPSCSVYVLKALDNHGLLKGTFLAFKRIIKCHPLNEGGYDPVPGMVSEIKIKTKKML